MTKARVMTWGETIDFLVQTGVAPSRKKDWVIAGLRLANMSKPEDAADIAWFFTTVFMGMAPRLGSGPTLSRWRASTASRKDTLQAWYDSFRKPSQWLREVFCAVVSDGYEAIQTYGPEVDKRCQEVREFGHPQFRDGTLVDELRVIARSQDSAVGYVAALFLDPRQHFGERLRQCAYSGDDSVACERFFMIPQDAEIGRPSLYCTPNHRAAAKKQSQRQRAMRYRIAQKVHRGKRTS